MEIEKIESSLAYGYCITKKQIVVLYFAIVTELLFPLVTILFFVLVLTGAVSWRNDIGFALIAGDILFLFIAVFLIAFIRRSSKQRSKVLLWIEDAIELKAFVRRLDYISPQFMPYQIQVDFEIDGEMYHRVSSPGGMFWGYHKIFAKYNNKEINILYSKEYDEVMILKIIKTVRDSV